MDLYNLGFITVQYGWKPKQLNNFHWSHPYQISTNSVEVYRKHGKL